jgi:hypothetical protein
MFRSPTRHQRHHPMDPPEQIWPNETIVVLPETPRVRLSPRRKMNPQTPGWASSYMGDTIRMYHDPGDQDETVNFAMNPDFIESKTPFGESVDETCIPLFRLSRRLRFECCHLQRRQLLLKMMLLKFLILRD